MSSSLRTTLLTACAFSVFAFTGAAVAAEGAAASPAAATAAAAATGDAGEVEEVMITLSKTTRSSVSLSGSEMQKLLPGVNPLKAIQTLPGVSYQTADPWGNNEQNVSLFVHGFSTQQLGFTMDGVPLGDQQYGNYNGLSPQRAITSENVAKTILSSGAGDLGVASTSNLGGAIEIFSSDPLTTRGGQIQQTLGSYAATRSFVRLDSGDFAGGNRAYISFLHQDQRAWDFRGHQRGNQINAKYVHEDDRGRLTAYLNLSDKVEPNEDAIVHVGTAATPYTRPFLYPDLAAALAYLSAGGAPPARRRPQLPQLPLGRPAHRRAGLCEVRLQDQSRPDLVQPGLFPS